MKGYPQIRERRQVPDDEPRWHASIVILTGVLLYVTLPPKLTYGPVWAFPLAVLAILVPLTVLSPKRHNEKPFHRTMAIVTIAIMNLWNVLTVFLLISNVLGHPVRHHTMTGAELLIGGSEIWLTNVLVFTLWFWELDGDGPEPRAHAVAATDFRDADFLFPQMTLDKQKLACAERPWKPRLADYMYLSFTNALAFSPTDVMPLSRMAKMLMLAESLLSFVTIAVVVSRSINILGSG